MSAPDTAVQAKVTGVKTARNAPAAPMLPVGWRSQDRPGAGSASGLVDLRHAGEGFAPGRGLAAVIVVFWSQPTGIVVLVTAACCRSCWA
jgi:hypothetical protein